MNYFIITYHQLIVAAQMRGPSQRGARFGAIGQIGLRPALVTNVTEFT